MAKAVITSTYVALGGTDYSAQVASADLAIAIDAVETTNMGSGGDREYLPGLRGKTLNVTFVKDGDLSGLDAAVFTAIAGAGTLSFEVRRTSSSVSATNPKYTGTCVITGWSPINGAVGARYEGQISWTVTGALTRATS